jgi:hypothetical protein
VLRLDDGALDLRPPRPTVIRGAAQPDPRSARGRSPEAVPLLGGGGAEILAFSGFPNELWSER